MESSTKLIIGTGAFLTTLAFFNRPKKNKLGDLSPDGRMVSERHYYASQDPDKKTAGEAAAIISKFLKIKVSAKELVEIYTGLNFHKPEWHHSGFYKNSRFEKKIMGRTYFFSLEDIEFFKENRVKIEEFKKNKAIKTEIEAEEKKRKEVEFVKGVYYTWEDGITSHRKEYKYKVLHIYEGNLYNAPKTFMDLTDEPLLFENAKTWVGRKYLGWDAPSHADFKLNKEEQKAIELEAEKQEIIKRKEQKAMEAEARLQRKEQNKQNTIFAAVSERRYFYGKYPNENIIKKTIRIFKGLYQNLPTNAVILSGELLKVARKIAKEEVLYPEDYVFSEEDFVFDKEELNKFLEENEKQYIIQQKIKEKWMEEAEKDIVECFVRDVLSRNHYHYYNGPRYLINHPYFEIKEEYLEQVRQMKNELIYQKQVKLLVKNWDKYL